MKYRSFRDVPPRVAKYMSPINSGISYSGAQIKAWARKGYYSPDPKNVMAHIVYLKYFHESSNRILDVLPDHYYFVRRPSPELSYPSIPTIFLQEDNMKSPGFDIMLIITDPGDSEKIKEAYILKNGRPTNRNTEPKEFTIEWKS